MEQQPALCAVLLESSDKVHRGYLPEGRECNVIGELVTILKPFVQATTLMSGSKYPTVSIIILCPLLYQLLEKTLSVVNDDSPTNKKIKNAIRDDLKDRYQDEGMQLTCMFQECAYLDPRFKDLDPFISEDEQCDVIEAVKLDMLEYVNQEEDEPNEEVTEETDLSTSAVSNPPKKRKVAASLFSGFTAAKDSRRASVHDIVLSEIRRYAEEDLLDYDSNAQEWWSSHKNAYPILAKLVRKYWCIHVHLYLQQV